MTGYDAVDEEQRHLGRLLDRLEELRADTRARLLPEWDELQSRVANDAASAEMQRRHSELHAIQFELTGGR